MNIIIVEDSVSLDEVKTLAQEFYRDMVKGVADIESGIIALGGEYHIDANEKLVEHSSRQSDVWGFNVYVDRTGEDWIECTSLINIRPEHGNRGMLVQDPTLSKRIRGIVEKRILRP